MGSLSPVEIIANLQQRQNYSLERALSGTGLYTPRTFVRTRHA
jgi:hypothetical protein